MNSPLKLWMFIAVKPSKYSQPYTWLIFDDRYQNKQHWQIIQQNFSVVSMVLYRFNSTNKTTRFNSTNMKHKK